jgi:hypothetical protein
VILRLRSAHVNMKMLAEGIKIIYTGRNYLRVCLVTDTTDPSLDATFRPLRHFEEQEEFIIYAAFSSEE